MGDTTGDDRERYLRKMSDRLHDRFLERPAYLDLGFIRGEINKLDSQIDDLLASGLTWERARGRLGDPAEYADAVFASRLLSPALKTEGVRPSILMTVLKVLFVIAPVNFLVAVGPLLIASSIVIIGWAASAAIVVGPVLILVHFALTSLNGVGLADVFLLIAIFAIGQLMALLMIVISRIVARAVWVWLRWNIAFLRSEPRK
jgi:uncharacterized membrane protein